MSSQEVGSSQIAAEMESVRQLAGLSDTHAIELDESGWTSRVYLVNEGEFVVKFPRSARVKEEYRKEIAFLRSIEDVGFPVLLPRLLWIDDDLAYVGYAGIVGQQLEALLPDAGDDFRKSIGAQIGGFLKQLHAVQNATAAVRSLEEEIDECQRKYALASDAYASNFSQQERAALDHYVQVALPRAMRELGRVGVLAHGDLGFWNMLVDANGVLGIIDFGDCGLWDASRDFMSLADGDILDAALSVYGENDLLREKISLRQGYLPLLELPYYVGKQDARAVAQTVARIRSSLLK
jgi:aminoglycoside phosphotransferase (APT) family kinase protein